MTNYVANTHVVVRVDGSATEVEPSKHLPEGVEQSEIDRLLRFDVISEVPDSKPAEEPKAPHARKAAAKPADAQGDASKVEE